MQLDKFIKIIGWRCSIQQALMALCILLRWCALWFWRTRLLLQQSFTRNCLCYFSAYGINAQFSKKYTEVLGKVSGEETIVSKPNYFSLVQGLTQRHQTTLVSAATPGNSASCSNLLVMVVILARSTTSQFLTDLHSTYDLWHMSSGAHLGKRSFQAEAGQLWGGTRDALVVLFLHSLFMGAGCSEDALFWISGFQQKLAQEVFQWVWCCHASS